MNIEELNKIRRQYRAETGDIPIDEALFCYSNEPDYELQNCNQGYIRYPKGVCITRIDREYDTAKHLLKLDGAVGAYDSDWEEKSVAEKLMVFIHLMYTLQRQGVAPFEELDFALSVIPEYRKFKESPSVGHWLEDTEYASPDLGIYTK